jgi:formate-dependent nitrite reductase cytochrome c552 subunit
VSEGICCPRTHYTCADCFDAHVRNEAGKDLALLAKTDGRILCPRNTAANTAADRCDAAHFADKDIAAQVTHETFELYLDARSKLKEKAVAAEMEAQMNERLERERARAALGRGKRRNYASPRNTSSRWCSRSRARDVSRRSWTLTGVSR